MPRLMPNPKIREVTISGDTSGDFNVKVVLALQDTVDSLGINTELFQFMKGPSSSVGDLLEAPDLTDYITLRIIQVMSPIITEAYLDNFTPDYDLAIAQAGLIAAEPQPEDYEAGADDSQYVIDHDDWEAQTYGLVSGKWYKTEDIPLNDHGFDGIDKYYDTVLSEGIGAPGHDRNKKYTVLYSRTFNVTEEEGFQGHLAYFAFTIIDMQAIARDFGLGPTAMASSIFDAIYSDVSYNIAMDEYSASSSAIDDTTTIFDLIADADEYAYTEAADCSHFSPLYLTATTIESLYPEGWGGIPWTDERVEWGVYLRGVFFFDTMRVARFESGFGWLLANESFASMVKELNLFRIAKIEISRLTTRYNDDGEAYEDEFLYADMTYDNDSDLETVKYYLHEDIVSDWTRAAPRTIFPKYGDGSTFIEEIGQILGFCDEDHHPIEGISFTDVGKDIIENTVRDWLTGDYVDPVFNAGMEDVIGSIDSEGEMDAGGSSSTAVGYKVCLTFTDEIAQYLIDWYGSFIPNIRLLERYYHDSLLPCHYHEYTESFNEVFIQFVSENYGSDFLTGSGSGSLAQIIIDIYTLKMCLIQWGVIAPEGEGWDEGIGLLLVTLVPMEVLKVNALQSTANPQYILDLIKMAEELLVALKSVLESVPWGEDTTLLESLADTGGSTEFSATYTNQVEVCCGTNSEGTYWEAWLHPSFESGTVDMMGAGE